MAFTSAERQALANLGRSEPANIRSISVAEQGKPSDLVILQELAVSNAYEIAAVVAVLERKGILTGQEVLDEIARQRKSRLRGK